MRKGWIYCLQNKLYEASSNIPTPYNLFVSLMCRYTYNNVYTMFKKNLINFYLKNLAMVVYFVKNDFF